MPSQKNYVISPDLMVELETTLSRLRCRLTTSDVPAAPSDYFRFKGYETCIKSIKNHVYGIGNDSPHTAQIEESLLRHDKREDEPTNEDYETFGD